MRILIDNLDGLGAVDYSGSVCVEGRLRVERKLNAPSRCTFTVVVGAGGLQLPARLARVVVTRDDASVLFTGYVTTEPVRVVAGAGSEGHVYRARVTAVSDEWLLDRQGSGAASGGGTRHSGVSLSLDGLSLLQRLAARAGGGLSVAGASGGRTVGAFTPQVAVPWSANAAAAASAAYARYRVVSGVANVQPAGAVTHAVSDEDGAFGAFGSLDVKALEVGAVRELANDVTLTGEMEAAAYVQECFLGDGSTSVFTLGETAYEGTERALMDDTFEDPAFDPAVWAVSDPASSVSLTAAGLTLNGGNGSYGATMLTALDRVEMTGALVVELGSVTITAASDGVLGGLYDGAATLADCVAGFRVRQDAGVTVLVPILDGSEVGATFAPAAGHKYTLRLRLHCVEMQRVRQQYSVMVDGVVETFGGGSAMDAPLHTVFELVDQGAASNTPATVLYDSAVTGPLGGATAACTFAVVNCASMFGAVGSVRVTRPGSAWVVSTLPSGVQQTRLMGVAGEGVDCVLQYGSTTKLTFLAGRVPQAGERVTVFYRRARRSVARMADAASIALEALGGAAGTCRWLGRVLQPAARSSVDCESAAQAVLAMSTARAAAVAGTYATANPAEDVWPGDVLAVTSDGVTSSLLIRGVAIDDGGAVPEVLRYKIAFANDWATELADGLGVRLSEAVAGDAVLPATAENSPGVALTSLQELAVTALSFAAIEIDVGVDAPAGGGFEVRWRDWAFGPRNDADLVLRSPVRNFSIPRAAQAERLYVRVYDGSSPPVYSRFSSAVFLNWPVG